MTQMQTSITRDFFVLLTEWSSMVNRQPVSLCRKVALLNKWFLVIYGLVLTLNFTSILMFGHTWSCHELQSLTSKCNQFIFVPNSTDLVFPQVGHTALLYGVDRWLHCISFWDNPFVWSWLHKKLVSEFGYLAAFSIAGGSKLSDAKKDAKFCTFWPL